MNPRAPRRRISPQTRRRCKAIKGFFKRALGSLSQPDLLQITSSIAVNVTDINHKIVGLEQHLSEVCRQCNEQHTARGGSARPTPQPSRRSLAGSGDPPERQLDRKLTDVIYTKSQNKLRKSTGSDTTTPNDDSITMNAERDPYRRLKLKKKKSKSSSREVYPNIASDHQKQNESTFKSFVSAYSTSSFRSLDDFRDVYYPTAGCSAYGGEKRNRTDSNNDRYVSKTYRDTFPERYDHPNEERSEKVIKKKKSNHNSAELDPDFIADIIKRQYKPVKFGRRHSDLSQFSTPVCRDHEFCRNTQYYIPEESAACRCGTRHPARAAWRRECCDARSVCDASLYAKRTRDKHHKRQPDLHKDSEIYDLVPVKEKSSPKSRRKYIEDSIRSAYHKEVPPSPRSHRPQLNLEARYAESYCNTEITRSKQKKNTRHVLRRDMEESYRHSSKRHANPKNEIKYDENEHEEDEELSEIHRKRRYKNVNNQQAACLGRAGNSIASGLYPALAAEDPTAAVETALDKTQDTVASDKTDKALCEIKDILQSFLLEIKKEASSHAEKSAAKMSESGNSPPPHDAGVMTSHAHSFTNFNSAQCPVPPSPFLPPTLPAFGNHPCCYPVMPMCAINCNACLQNSGCLPPRYPAPSASFTCKNCCERSDDTYNTKNTQKSDAANEPLTCETDELIKQIYKFVSQSPTFSRKGPVSKGDNRTQKGFRTDVKLLTSRSAGGSTRLRRHDARVGTTKMNCASKSCEAIGTKTSSDTESDTSGSYSDTVLDKFSLEATRSTSGTERRTDSLTRGNKTRQSKFTKVLNSLGLRKKMKRDAIEELSESESPVETEEKKRAPFRQQVGSYMMYGQEYCRPPPVSPHYRPEHACHQRPPLPSAPPYCGSHSYDGYSTPMQPQVPLCLKEVEVKSIGCQSERKLSFFRKMTRRGHTPPGSSDEPARPGTTRTQRAPAKPAPAPLFSWKQPSKDKQKLDSFGYETQKKLALGDIKMRNAMLKKMFYKRNPFSPRNLIIKTLLGKDKTSYGEPPTSLRPRMFF